MSWPRSPEFRRQDHGSARHPRCRVAALYVSALSERALALASFRPVSPVLSALPCHFPHSTRRDFYYFWGLVVFFILLLLLLLLLLFFGGGLLRLSRCGADFDLAVGARAGRGARPVPGNVRRHLHRPHPEAPPGHGHRARRRHRRLRPLPGRPFPTHVSAPCPLRTPRAVLYRVPTLVGF